LSEQHSRIGAKNVDEIKSHAFFKGIEWDKLRVGKAVFAPELSSPLDTSHFEHFEEEEPVEEVEEEDDQEPEEIGDTPRPRAQSSPVSQKKKKLKRKILDS